ncbi:MAG: molybdate ABC transporter substrate-binding protein [Roseibium sp.]|uniref:molybdate ABC transporter substrate-binding protein n=1 Tax=Roseibium sp. TaxID=1936156 RepID=UPI00261764F4|nr:molybdate ABC transporter substrate-binding protein [Roseibium sp.]MCV0425258.1 molybdate ABC transporter substrate-binding protein [Roseibium sp.]
MFRRLFLLSVLLSACLIPATAQAPLTVFAAASMREAMERIGTVFEKETGVEIVFSFAGTGTLARQVEAGAPADVFVSADINWMTYAEDQGAVRPETVHPIASNALVLIGARETLPLELKSAELEKALGGARMAIADTDTVPAGRYGKAALESLGLWQSVATQLAPMENVRIVLASVARGDTPLGLVYQTDAAIEPAVSVLAEFPEGTHPKIEYLAALTTEGDHPDATAFLEFLRQQQARDILRSLGFLTDKMK